MRAGEGKKGRLGNQCVHHSCKWCSTYRPKLLASFFRICDVTPVSVSVVVARVYRDMLFCQHVQNSWRRRVVQSFVPMSVLVSDIYQDSGCRVGHFGPNGAWVNPCSQGCGAGAGAAETACSEPEPEP